MKSNYNIKGVDVEFEKMVALAESTLRQTFDTNYETQEATLDYITKGINHARLNNFDEIELIWNIAGYANIISYDLKIIARDMAFAKNEWQKRLYARQACLIIYESIDDLLELLGRKFIEFIKKNFDNKETQTIIKSVKKNLNEFKNNNSRELYKIRNIAIAHRDIDVLKQVDTIHKISWYDSFTLVTSFDPIINEVAAMTMMIIKKQL